MNPLRSLPSVDQVLKKLKNVDGLPQHILANEIRAVLSKRRNSLSGAEAPNAAVEQEVEARIQALLKSSLRRVINASGVILHTNLGRAPLAKFEPIPRYSNLEYDLETGKRGKRDAHIAPLLEALLGRPAIVVNNNAAAVFLVLHELAAGYEVIVSRGELIEIGDGFRIPEIMARSGALLREVGTTNRTRIEDYSAALNERTRLILRVHPSNFRISGFTGRPALAELAQLGRERGIPVYEDLGSGCLVDLRPLGMDEPLVEESFAAGTNLVSFSCDKLLGGPQSGIVAGDPALVHRIRRNPLYRALRVDKLILQSLEATLHHLIAENWQAIPTLRMIFQTEDEVRARAERVAAGLRDLKLEIRQSETAIGGGSTPEQTLPTWVIELQVDKPQAFEHRLRSAEVPVITRIEHDRVVLDLRTVADEEEEELTRAIRGSIP